MAQTQTRLGAALRLVFDISRILRKEGWEIREGGVWDVMNLYLSTASHRPSADSAVTIVRAKVNRDSRGWARVSCLNILTDRDLNAPIHSSWTECRRRTDVRQLWHVDCTKKHPYWYPYTSRFSRQYATRAEEHQSKRWTLTTLITFLTYGKLRTKPSLLDQKVVWKISH